MDTRTRKIMDVKHSVIEYVVNFGQLKCYGEVQRMCEDPVTHTNIKLNTVVVKKQKGKSWEEEIHQEIRAWG